MSRSECAATAQMTAAHSRPRRRYFPIGGGGINCSTVHLCRVKHRMRGYPAKGGESVDGDLIPILQVY